jgi:hypothetical protein
MRRALKEACLLVEDFGDESVAAEVARDLRGAEWSRALGTLCISRYPVGEAGRAARCEYVLSPRWQSFATALSGQPVVYWLAERGLAWPTGDGVVVVYTTDVEEMIMASATDRRPGVPERGALPALSCWPVIGHPGRLVVVIDDMVEVDGLLRRLTDEWGPPAEPAVIHQMVNEGRRPPEEASQT